MIKRALILVAYFLSPFIPIAVTYASSPARYSNPVRMLALTMGAMAYTWIAAQFVTSSRPRYFERIFGLDRIYRVHGFAAVICATAALTHKLIEESIRRESFVTNLGNTGLMILIGAACLALIFMTDALTSRIGILKAVIKPFEKTPLSKYDIHVAIHNITILGFVLVFAHVMLVSSSRMFPVVRAIYIIYFATAIGAYLWHKLARPYSLRKNRGMYTVESVIRENANTWTIEMSPDNGKLFSYKPGQFVFLRIFGDDVTSEEHPFSISSSHSDKSKIAVTVKELGDFTAGIGNVRVGDKATLDGPYGKFSYMEYPKSSKVVFLAGGVGITPVISMIKHMAEYDRERDVTLIWGLRSADDIIQSDRIEAAQNAMESFKLIFVASDGQPINGGETGRLDAAKISHIFNRHDIDVNSEFFVCGPPPMMKGVISSLVGMGVVKKKIHFEKFSL